MLSPGRLIALRSAVIADLKVFLPEMRSIEPHFGPFDLDDLKSFSIGGPAIKVSLLGWKPSEDVSTRELDCHAHLAAYIVTKPQGTRAADAIAIDIAEALAGRLVKKSYTPHSLPGERIGCTNHYTGGLREAGQIALFSVDWHAFVRIGTNAPAARYATEGGAEIGEVSIGINGGDPVPLEDTDVE